jgi:hypothetical protein
VNIFSDGGGFREKGLEIAGPMSDEVLTRVTTDSEWDILERTMEHIKE